MVFELLYEVLFQLSLAVLVRYRLPVFVFSLGWSSPPVFSQNIESGLLTGTVADPSRHPSRV